MPIEARNSENSLYNLASCLALVTIFYNLVEGVVSLIFGLQDSTIALLGFGVDSFVEMISGIGIWHMIRRMRLHDAVVHDTFERSALRVTGSAFYLLAAGMVLTAGINIYYGYRPETTFWGVVVSIISILTMWLLISYKKRVGNALKSEAILADANCTKVCMWLSVVLFVSSSGYELTGMGFLDSLGAIGISIFSYKEGREAFQKAKGNTACCCKQG